MTYGREAAVSVVPVPGVKPLTPYSTIHELPVPFSVQVTVSIFVSLLERVMSVTGGHAGIVSTSMSSTK